MSPRLNGYYLDRTPSNTIGVCRACGARFASLSPEGARTMTRAHVFSMHAIGI